MCPKGPKIRACKKQARVGGFVPGSPGLGRAGSPHARAPFQVLLSLENKRRWKQRCRGVWLQFPSCSPHPWPVPVPLCSSPWDTRAAAGLGCPSAAEWKLWPVLNEGCAFVLFSMKASSQLITENVCSSSLNPSTASVQPLARADLDAIQDGSRGHTGGSSALPGLLPHPPHCWAVEPWGVQHPEHLALDRFGSCFPQFCPPDSWDDSISCKGLSQPQHNPSVQSMGLFTCLNTSLSAFA